MNKSTGVELARQISQLLWSSPFDFCSLRGRCFHSPWFIGFSWEISKVTHREVAAGARQVVFSKCELLLCCCSGWTQMQGAGRCVFCGLWWIRASARSSKASSPDCVFVSGPRLKASAGGFSKFLPHPPKNLWPVLLRMCLASQIVAIETVWIQSLCLRETPTNNTNS